MVLDNLHCAKCGTTFKRQLVLALMIEFGARTTDPNICSDDGGEHRWREGQQEERTHAMQSA